MRLIIFLPSYFSVPFILLQYLRLWLALLVMFLFTDSNPRLTVLVTLRIFDVSEYFWYFNLRRTCRPEATLKWGGICKNKSLLLLASARKLRKLKLIRQLHLYSRCVAALPSVCGLFPFNRPTTFGSSFPPFDPFWHGESRRTTFTIIYWYFGFTTDIVFWSPSWDINSQISSGNFAFGFHLWQLVFGPTMSMVSARS